MHFCTPLCLFAVRQIMETAPDNSHQWLPWTGHRNTTCAYILVAEIVAHNDNKAK